MTQEIPADQEWVTVPAVAKVIGTGKRTVYKAIRRGELQASPVNGRGDLRIHRDWLRAWMELRAAMKSAA